MGVSTYDLIKDAYRYFFEYTEWLQVHFYTILKAGEFEVYLRYFMLLLTIILMASNVIQSIKRLHDMGVGIWWYLLPLYNPLALLIKKPKVGIMPRCERMATKEGAMKAKDLILGNNSEDYCI